MNSSPPNITQMLAACSRGHAAALDQLIPVVYDELRRLADHNLRRVSSYHTLQPTALIHEAYLRLADQTDIGWQNRAHFFGIAAHLMRCILVDYARRNYAAKRGGAERPLSLETAGDWGEEKSVDLVALDDALLDLATLDPQKSRLVELRFFGGLSIEETAEVMGLSPRTVKRQWRTTRAWLHRELHKA
ncbi:MAG: sigma-70 family RNA polymerase sigma factor [Acidobacteria bacterium]|nr:sigma-70 family RNA polymerase sigma factor [Acidobacteriota bacterium]